jgi:hypothetical protein
VVDRADCSAAAAAAAACGGCGPVLCAAWDGDEPPPLPAAAADADPAAAAAAAVAGLNLTASAEDFRAHFDAPASVAVVSLTLTHPRVCLSLDPFPHPDEHVSASERKWVYMCERIAFSCAGGHIDFMCACCFVCASWLLSSCLSPRSPPVRHSFALP